MTDTELSEVLEGYAIATPDGNDQETLKLWMTRHPEFADDLMDFAAARALARTPDDASVPFEAERYAEFGLRALRQVLGAGEAGTLASLTAAAQEKGWKKKEFAEKLGLSPSLVMYLEKRRLQASTIPRSIIERIARVLETTEQAIASYLELPPALAGEASFKTQTRPEEVRQRSFADAVREDQTLTPGEKQDLLSQV